MDNYSFPNRRPPYPPKYASNVLFFLKKKSVERFLLIQDVYYDALFNQYVSWDRGKTCAL